MYGKGPKAKSLHLGLLASALAIIGWSMIKPVRWDIWLLEVLPALAGTLFLVLTYNKFRLTTCTYVLIWISIVIMAIGGHYTYGRVHFFDFLKEAFHLSRNYYDRFAHFVHAGSVALIVRELLLRKSKVLPERKLLFLLILAICLALSASYEILEFAIAKIASGSAEAFLGTQGDVWDTPQDMLLGLTGSTIALLLLARLHDKQLGEFSYLDTNHIM